MESSRVFLALMCVAYFLLLVFLAIQFHRLVRFKHDFQSFQSGFISLTVVWVVFRSVYFLLGLFDYTWPTLWTQILIYWVPYGVQFNTFSLLILFYGSLVHDRSVWEENKHIIGPCFLGINILIYGFIGGWIGIGVAHGSSESLERGVSYFASCIFLFLSISLTYYGMMVHKRPDGYNMHVLYRTSEYSWPILTGILLFSFYSRAFFNLYFAVEPKSIASPHRRAIDYDLDTEYCIWSFVWELVPVILILTFFKIPDIENMFKRKSHAHLENLPPLLYMNINSPHGEQSYFQNPRRYDSDEDNESETSSLLESPIEIQSRH